MKSISQYNDSLEKTDKQICETLYTIICSGLPQAENKLWHAHPVWFLDGNPIVGYSKQKGGIKLMFWSGADFDEAQLKPGTGKFKDAGIFYNAFEEIHEKNIKRWLEKGKNIQWDYKNIVKRKGKLERIK